ncbi:MAG: OadG family protein [Lachnoclostridium sp.]|nr:OadG family protein [Lachnoclostridium sp.]
MKQNMKKIWIALCMAVCLFALSGCSKAAEAEEAVDPSVVMVLQQVSQQYLELLDGMSDADLELAIASSAKSKDTVMETAYKSWQSVKDDLGELVSYEAAVVERTEDGFVARIDAVFEKRNMEFSLMTDENLSGLEGLSISPEYSTGEKMAKAGMNTLMGMGVVFVVLIFISLLISCFKYINVFETKLKEKNAAKTAPTPAAATAPAAAPAPAPAAVPVVEEEEICDDTELISVIAAAIAASEGKTSANGLVVRSIKRVPNRNWK